ncbi:MAG: diguanylate cyclase [Frankiales bacterium]|jgi:diguanylate cyclase (GGDEF)-like protein|nr:diguanylate cyclase [Frankiales bacterium]
MAVERAGVTVAEDVQGGLAVIGPDGSVESSNAGMARILGSVPVSLDSFPPSVRRTCSGRPGRPWAAEEETAVSLRARWSAMRSGQRWILQAQPLDEREQSTDFSMTQDGRIAAIAELHHDLASADFDVQDIVQWLVQRSRVLFGDSEASLGMLEGDSIVYKVLIGGRRGRVVDNRTTVEGSMSGTCLLTGVTMVSDDVEVDARADLEACRRAGLRSMVLVPLRHRGENIGVLNVNAAVPDAYTAADVSTVELVGGVLSVAYSHAADLSAKRELVRELGRTLSALQDTQAQLVHDALHDPLTQLPNRVLFHDRLRQALAQSARTGSPIAVLFVDVDRFKVVNDSLGHEAGDVLLAEVADRLQECLRATDTAARLGGDEFTVLCTGADGGDEALTVAHRIAARLGERVMLPGGEVFPTVSIGIARSTDADDSAADLLDRADLALYRAKQGGRNRIEVHDGHMQRGAQSRLALENDLRRAVQLKQLVVAYQPQYSVRTSRIVGIEALLRWRHPDRGLLLPGEFLDIAEETALIVPVGAWVLEQACRAAHHWSLLAGRPVPVSVNLSRRQLDDPALTDTVAKTLRSAGIDGAQLSLEILEDVIVDDDSQRQKNLFALHAMGVRLDVDDFGVGYSSLAQLQKFPVANLKIDKSLVDRVESEDAVVVAVIHMAHALGFTVVAEGVETIGQQDVLARLGCDTLQGYLLSKPCPEAIVDDLLLGD